MNAALERYKKVEDLPFPAVDPNLTSDELEMLVDEYEVKVRRTDATTVHIMGELTFTHRLVNRLTSIGIHCIASTTQRIIKSEENGNKTSTFRFSQFRSY